MGVSIVAGERLSSDNLLDRRAVGLRDGRHDDAISPAQRRKPLDLRQSLASSRQAAVDERIVHRAAAGDEAPKEVIFAEVVAPSGLVGDDVVGGNVAHMGRV